MSAPPETGEAAVAEETPVRCVCGRLLADPVSRARGLGPRCYRRLRGRTAARGGTARVPTAPQPGPGQLALDLEGLMPRRTTNRGGRRRRTRLDPDLWGQRIPAGAHLTTIRLTGSYL
ncbi:DUF6011 domain-containing protein [Streptomyces sp. NPDC057413]|uniref:DUF6011 domain-containing protein n=1 Tax=Streptomyces sp. NPDC057413 TaxID=3346124 RepID=UPI0036C5FC06